LSRLNTNNSHFYLVYHVKSTVIFFAKVKVNKLIGGDIRIFIKELYFDSERLREEEALNISFRNKFLFKDISLIPIGLKQKIIEGTFKNG